jgi:HSP20 family protein
MIRHPPPAIHHPPSTIQEFPMATDTRGKQGKASTDHPVRRSSRHQHNVHRWEPNERSSYNPFALMRQGLDEMDHWFSRLGFGRGRLATPSARSWLTHAAGELGDWSPAIEAFQRGNEFVVRAEVPGMNRHDLIVEVGDDTLTIRGERKHEQQEDHDGVFWSERSYGSFCRAIPLPPGAISDSAKASFNNGVLEVVTQAPSQDARRGRKIDISGTPDTK